MFGDFPEIATDLRHPEANSSALRGIRRAIQSIGWGVRWHDRALIAAYYGLLMASTLSSGGLKLGRGVHPRFWLGDLSVSTPIGRFECRGGTTDFEITNPNYEEALVRALAHRLANFRTRRAVFVDVGAHIGKYSVLAGRILRDSGNVVAIEPDPDNFKALAGNVRLNGLDNVSLFNIGCWSQDGSRVLHQQVGDLGGHSLVDKTRGGSITVPVRTLDGLLSEQPLGRVDIIKLDVQRAEVEVLKGARATIESNPEVRIFFEETARSSTAESLRLLRDLRFQVERLDEFNYVAQRSP